MLESLKSNAITPINISSTKRYLSDEEVVAELNNPRVSLEKKVITFINETCRDIYIKNRYDDVQCIRSRGTEPPTAKFIFSYQITSTKESLLATKESLLACNGSEVLKSVVNDALESMENEGLDGSSSPRTGVYEYDCVIDTSSFTDKSVHYDYTTDYLISFDRDKVRAAILPL